MHDEDVDERGRRQCAYRMRADRDAFLIVGLEGASATGAGHASSTLEAEVDWHSLLEQPPSEDVDAA